MGRRALAPGRAVGRVGRQRLTQLGKQCLHVREPPVLTILQSLQTGRPLAMTIVPATAPHPEQERPILGHAILHHLPCFLRLDLLEGGAFSSVAGYYYCTRRLFRFVLRAGRLFPSCGPRATQGT